MIGKTNATTVAEYWYGKCSSTPTTAHKVVTVQSGFRLKEGVSITVLFDYANTAGSPTLNVNGTGQIDIFYADGRRADNKAWARDEVVEFIYAEGVWNILKNIAAESRWGSVALMDEPSDAQDVNGGYAATPKAVQTAIDESLPKTGGTLTGNLVVPQIGGQTGTTQWSLNGTTLLYATGGTETKMFRIAPDTTNGGGIVQAIKGSNNAQYTFNPEGVVNNNDIVNKQYVDIKTSGWYGECKTIPNIEAKIANVQDGFELKAGVVVNILFVRTNTSYSPTLNVNSTGAHRIYWAGGTDTALENAWRQNEIVTLVYDGEYWNILKSKSNSTSFGNVILSDEVDKTLGASTSTAATPAAVQTAINTTKVWEAICDTPTDTSAKVATVDGDFNLVNGIKVRFFIESGFKNDVINTLNVNNTGAFTILTSDGDESFSDIVGGGTYWNFTYVENAFQLGGDPCWVIDNTPIGGNRRKGIVSLLDLPNSIAGSSEGVAATPLGVDRAITKVAPEYKNWYGECTDGAAIVDRTVNVGDGFVLKDGVSIRVLMVNTSIANITLNVNGTGAKYIVFVYGGSHLNYAGAWKGNDIITLTYMGDTDEWILQDRGLATPTRTGVVMKGGSLKQTTGQSNYLVPTTQGVAQAFNNLVATQFDDFSVITLTAANWTSDNTYSLEAEYPNAMYNLQISISSTATLEQYEAYNASGIIGDNTMNVLIARNGKPTIDIPVKIQSIVRNWSDI